MSCAMPVVLPTWAPSSRLPNGHIFVDFLLTEHRNIAENLWKMRPTYGAESADCFLALIKCVKVGQEGDGEVRKMYCIVRRTSFAK